MRTALLIIGCAMVAFILGALIVHIFKPQSEIYREILPESEIRSEQ